ncbi:MAG: glycoside hydrolase family 27 protein [Parabacteroides sp.]|nr:glycoside hydrolase family 27 protein [Parabacteroides sp.]
MKKWSLIIWAIFCLPLFTIYADSGKGKFIQWAPTPPMGWNSWDCYGPTVTENEVKANADYMAEYLKPYGWEYIVVDIRWYVQNDKAGGYNEKDPVFSIDDYGRYIPAVNRFPSSAGGRGFKSLADYIHARGLKFGIHLMRGIPKVAVQKKMPVKGTDITADQIYGTELLCAWLGDNYTVRAAARGAQEYYNSLFELYASWGVDFVKIDDLSRPYHQDEIELIRNAIDHCGRPIVLSTSPGETPVEKADHVRTHANMWRMVDDVWDTWPHFRHLIKVCQDWYSYISPTWPDCDMIPLGRIAIRGERGLDRMTRLTKDEQYSLMTLFTIFRSPLMFGGDLPSNDAFTLSLLTNKAVLEMHGNGQNVRQIFQKDGRVAVTSKNAKTDAVYLALFNISDDDSPLDISVDLNDLGLNDRKVMVTDLWEGRSLGKVKGTFHRLLNKHACGLYMLK